MTQGLRVAVVGAGRMGANHARVLATQEGVALAGILDVNASLAAALAKIHGCPAFGAIDELREKVDAAVVAASSAAHHGVAGALLEAGIPCLVEKPLALDEKECLDLIAIARRRGVVLAVGHIERFNPAFRALRDRLGARRIDAADAVRLNAGSARITDTDVVSDLMVHDLDAIIDLMGGEPETVEAAGVALAPGGQSDHATALLRYADGRVATCRASRVTAARVRELRLIGEFGTAVMDYLQRSATVISPDGTSEPLPIPADEALAAEIGGFAAAVNDRGGDIVTGDDALRTMRTVWAVQRELARGLSQA